MSTVVCWFQRTLKQLEREQTDTQTDRQTDRQTDKTTTVTLAHARRGLITFHEVNNRIPGSVANGVVFGERGGICVIESSDKARIQHAAPPARKSSQGICAGKGRVCEPSNCQREVTLLLPSSSSFRRVVREPAEEYRRGG